MQIHIANPIYDASFKFLMENDEAAKVLITEIIRKKVISLEYQPQESVVLKKRDKTRKTKEQKNAEKSVLRLDFLAKIELENGKQKAVAIELQKYKQATDLVRFREYLSGLYLKESLRQKDNSDVPLPIYTIYLLGSGYGNLSFDHPVLYVSPEVRDAVTMKRIEGEIDFVNALHPHTWIAQLERLRGNVRDDMERLLALFDVRTKVYDNPEELSVDESAYPKRFKPVLRRLVEANATEYVRLQMRQEKLDRRDMEALREEKEALREEKEALCEELKEKEEELKEKDKELRTKAFTIADQASALEEKERQVAELLKEVERLKKEKK